MTPAQRHTARIMAALQGAANPEQDRAAANQYELQLMQLAEHRRTLKGIQSLERKIDAKRTMLATYTPWIDGLLAADRGGQDDVMVTVMLWHLDTGDLAGALPMADYVIRHGLNTPDQYERTAPTLIAEEVADTAIKLQEAGNGPSLPLLSSYMSMLADCDIFDQVRAKLHKAVGRACYAEGLKEQAADHYRRAIELHDKVGIKRELEDLVREIKKEKAAAGQPANEPAPQPGAEPQSESPPPEQPDPAPGEAS